MKTRTVAAIWFVLSPTLLLAQPADSAIKVGDVVILDVTGDVAKNVVKRMSPLLEGRPLDGCECQLSATVRNVSADGTLYIEFLHIAGNEKPIRLITLAGKVDQRKITTNVMPKGTKIQSSPGAEPTFTTEDLLNRRLKLTELKGFKLQTWNLAEELGE